MFHIICNWHIQSLKFGKTPDTFAGKPNKFSENSKQIWIPRNYVQKMMSADKRQNRQNWPESGTKNNDQVGQNQ